MTQHFWIKQIRAIFSHCHCFFSRRMRRALPVLAVTLFANAVAWLWVWPTPATAAPPVYDNFSESYLNVKRWTPLSVPLYAQEWRREISDGALRLYLRGTPGSYDESLIGGHRDVLNGVSISARREASVRSIQVKLEIASADVRRCSRSDAEISEGMFLLAGAWFNDGRGTPGRDQTGDIRTSVAVSHNSGSRNQLNIIAQIYRNDGANGVNELYRRGLGVVGFATPVVIRVTWDERNKTFRFFRRTVVGSLIQQFEVDYTRLANPTNDVGPAVNSYHTLQARAEPAYCGREATHAEIDVLIDQVRVSNGASGN